MSSHTRTNFDADLSAVRSEVMQMGRLVRQTTAEALAALARRDADLARKQIERDRTIDVIHRRIETKAIETIARRQPVAVDLRELIGAVRIANDLERIGDLAKSICKRVLLMDAPVHPDLLQPITRVSTPAMRQLGLVLESYADRDSGQALSVWSSDKEIDAAHAALLRELLTHMVEDPRNIVVCAHLLFCSKNLERIGDHTTNIAESVHYLVTGQRLDGERPRGEDLSFWRAPSFDLPA